MSHWPVISEKLFTFINEELPNVSRGLLVVTGRAVGGGCIFLKTKQNMTCGGTLGEIGAPAMEKSMP